ncbi:MAG TPA: type VI secretion system baseplate subunit TssF [Flavipsychrobacter sp.]|nr:type VI secretion system baseplate subunit TssF [Flavipsychrobacter sp.]
MFQASHTSLSKEAIASRMFRSAARFWGLSDTNMDNFDPLVRLLIEACAVEIYRIDNEMVSLQRSMTEHLAGLLVPEIYIQPRPAHAIIHAPSTDPQMYVTTESQFVHQKRVASMANGPLDSSMDVFFSPAGRFKTIDADVQLIAAADHIYKVNMLQQKETFLRAQQPFTSNTAWIGINVKPQQDLRDLSLFFDLKNTPDKARLLSSLGYVKCFVGDTEIGLLKGLSPNNSEDSKLVFEESLEELYVSRRTEKMIGRIYANHFLTITLDEQAVGHIEAHMLSRFPEEWHKNVGSNDLGLLQNDLLWLRLEFPAEFNAQIIDDLTIAINCFPVANRHLNNITYRLNSYFNIIPLLTDEQFFSVHAVDGTYTNPSGRTDYVYYPFDRYDHAEKGTYTVRSGDLQRFDSRNAAEYLNYLVELLRDESRAFAAFGQDFLATTIKDLNQNIELISQKIRQNLNLLHTAPTYLLINPMQEGDTIFVQYWTCNGEAGNGIRSGSKMDLYEGSSFKKESLVLMTQTTGGMDKLKNTEILTAFKSVMISRNRLVTSADIQNFCFNYLQEKAKEVNVSRGVAISAMPDQGLIPVINVSITPSQNVLADWENIKTELLAELKDKSAVDVNYVIQTN